VSEYFESPNHSPTHPLTHSHPHPLKNSTMKVAIITGSSQGIGKALAEAMLAKGIRVVLNGRNGKKLEKARQYFFEKGHEVLAVQGDVSKVEDCERLIKDTVAHFGRLDILVNNAGIATEGKVMETGPEVFRKAIEVNYLGSVYPTQFALPHIIENRGSVLFISSLAAIHGLPNFSIYSSSKMTLKGLAEALKIELKGKDVHIGMAYVGFTENDPNKTIIKADGKAEILPKRTEVKVEPVEKVAARLLRMIEKRTFKKTFTPMGKALVFFERLAPGIVEMILGISFRKREKEKELGN